MRNALMMLQALLLLAAGALAQTPAGAANRPITLHPDNPHYLLFRDKPTILITSGEHYGAVLNLDFDFVSYLRELQSHGLNQTRTFSGTYFEIPESFGITDNPLSPKRGRYIGPWARSGTPGAGDGGNKFDLTQFDPAYFERLKDFVREAGQRGVVVEYVLFCTLYNDALWNVSPMNPKNNVNNLGVTNRREVFTMKHQDLVRLQTEFVRKVVAELKDFDNLYYEICNEPYFEGVADDWQAHIAATIVEAEKDFPTRHLIAQNIANGSRKIEKPDPNVSIFNFHYATPPDAVAQNYQLNKVIGDDETGFRGKDDVHYRTEAWDFIIAGGAIYSNLDYSFTPGHPGGTLTDFKSPGGGGESLRRQLSILKRFIEGFDFIRMAPQNQVIRSGTITAALSGNPAQSRPVTVRVLAEIGKAYAIYVRGGRHAQLAVELPAGSYKVEWINTKTGDIDKSETIQHEGGQRKLASPQYEEDIALRIMVER